MSTRQFQTRQFLLPKSGLQLSECEDAIGVNPGVGRFAIADGATEAFDSRSWALRLAENWVKDDSAALSTNQFRDWIADQGLALHDSWNGLKLSWYAEEKARSGSFATFVGVQVRFDQSPGWEAVALGDACLVHRREQKILKAFPLSDSESFTATPPLLPSKHSLQGAALESIVFSSGSLEPGDVLLLLSDAVAAWYLKLRESNDQTSSRFDGLLRTGQNDGLVGLFESERQAGRIRDDDIAVLSIAVVDQHVVE